MKKLFAICLLPVCTGCLSLTATNPTVADWPVQAGTLAHQELTPRFGVTRLSLVAVRAPYDVRQLAVSRADSTLAFDGYNRFAAQPSQLLKGVAQDVLAASGRFKSVVAATSAAAASHVAELTVTDLRLDCSGGTREAVAGVSLMVLDRSREIVALVSGAGRCEAADGDYGAAFSSAFTLALEKALGAL